MKEALLLGFGLILLSATCNGLLALPSKFVKSFAWENTWGAFYLFTMLVIPTIFATFFLKGVFPVWSAAGVVTLFHLMGFGILWGCGMIFFGMGIKMVGMALGYAVMMGLGILFGSIVPLIARHPDKAFTTSGLTVIAGILTCTLGVGVCGRAGVLRERSQTRNVPDLGRTRSANMIMGLIVCAVGGIMGATINIGFSYGTTIIALSRDRFGNSPGLAALTVWIVIFWGGFMASGSYAIYLLFKNRTWKNFVGASTGHDLAMSFLMALFHFLILFFYGMAAYHLGRLGTSVGWASHMSVSLVLANLLGFMTGEWNNSSQRSRGWLYAGLSLIIGGIVILAIGNQLQSVVP
jgi:L-rhamnose-proton symport protein (RhaT)